MSEAFFRDFLIVGQGLAGSALAMALRQKGSSVLVVDAVEYGSASEVAGGLVTPLAGKGMNPGWRQTEYLAEALAYYRRLEREHQIKLFHDISVVRPFKDEAQKIKFERNLEKREAWLSDDTSVPKGVKAECGAFAMQGGGWLDTSTYLKLIRDVLGDDFEYGVVAEEALSYQENEVHWLGRKFKKVIFCNGYRGLLGGPFSFLKSRSAKGEMLKIRVEGLDATKIISRNGWLVPLGESIWRAGASYSWDDLDEQLSDAGLANVKTRIESLIELPYEVIEQTAGVRPILNNSQPVVGLHPDYPCLGMFNGLGSKGVTTSRSVALHFVNYLSGEIELDPELDYRRLMK